MFSLISPETLPLLDSQLLLAGFFFIATAALIALCVPGVLIPMALGSGALLGPAPAAAAVVLGAVAGSQIMFVTARHLLLQRAREKLGQRFHGFEQRFTAHGAWYVVGLRLIGTPHFLVTGGAALVPIGPAKFAVATLVGFLPAITIAAMTGSAI